MAGTELIKKIYSPPDSERRSVDYNKIRSAVSKELLKQAK